MPIWLKEKLLLKKLLKSEFLEIDKNLSESSLPPLLFTEHHESHAASAFYPSPFEKAAILCVDGVGRMGDNHDLGGGRDIDQTAVGHPFSSFLGSFVLCIYLFHRVEPKRPCPRRGRPLGRASGNVRRCAWGPRCRARGSRRTGRRSGRCRPRWPPGGSTRRSR